MLRPFAAALLALALAFAGGSARAAEPEHITKAREITLSAAEDLDASPAPTEEPAASAKAPLAGPASSEGKTVKPLSSGATKKPARDLGY